MRDISRGKNMKRIRNGSRPIAAVGVLPNAPSLEKVRPCFRVWSFAVSAESG
jgi:hypothetical protein